MEPRRAQRVAETLREELAEIIEYEMTDPRIGLLTVTEVVVSPDMRNAVVRVMLTEEPRERERTLRALDSARNYIRRELAARVQLFRIPDLHFEADSGAAASERVEELLRRVRKNRAKTEKNSETTP